MNGPTLTQALEMAKTACDMIRMHLESQTIAGRERAAKYNNSLKQWVAKIDHIFINPEQYAYKTEQALHNSGTDEGNEIQIHPNGVIWIKGAFDLQKLRNNLVVR